MSTSINSSGTANKPAESLAEPAHPSSEPPPLLRETPRLALRCDGKLLLAITDLEGLDLSSREVWIGIVASEAEASDVHDRLDFEEAASPTIARIRALLTKAPPAAIE